jgi:cytochrome c oxidase subunit 2
MTSRPRRVLIVSSHPLFARGLSQLLQKRQEADADVVGVVSSADEAIEAIRRLAPDLAVVDYDDGAVNREAFLTRFMKGAGRLRVVLLSLKEGGDQAVVYDRRNMAASQIDEWLEEWIEAPKSGVETTSAGGASMGRTIQDQRRSSMKHWIGVIVLIIILAAAGILGLRNDWLLTTAASEQARSVDLTFSVVWILIAGLFALILGFMLYSVIFFRRKPGDETDAQHVEGNNALEVTWTVLPLVTVIGFAVFGSQTLAETLRVDPQAMEVRVIGQQWSWRFEYPEQELVSDELVLPINKQVHLVMESVDVLHSFWVPEFRLKQDLVPGRETELRITPNKIGEYQLMCAEICGSSHAFMTGPVRVVGQAEFEQWVFSKSDLPADPVARGQIWSEQYGCKACHSLDGTPGVGPSWLGLAGKTESFADGTSGVADDAYLREAILNPNARVVNGYAAGVMPQNYAEQLNEAQVNDIIEFIKSLK